MAGLELKTHRDGDVHVIRASGRITMNRGPSPLRERVRDLIQAGARRIVVDLSEVDYVDSAGLGEILSAYSSVVRRGGTLYFSNPARNVSGLFELTRLDRVLDICANEEAAVRAVRARQVKGESNVGK